MTGMAAALSVSGMPSAVVGLMGMLAQPTLSQSLVLLVYVQTAATPCSV